MPATVLRLVGLAKEPVKTWGGTSVIRASVRLAGVTDASLSVTDEVDQEAPMGWLAPATVSAQVAQAGEGSVEQTLSYQDVCYWLDGMFGPATASAAANTTYVYNYAAPLNSVSSPKTYFMQFGTTAALYKMRGAIVNNASFAVEAGAKWTASIGLLGKAVSTLTRMSTAPERTVDVIRAADTKIYVDTWAGTIGSTELPATLISATLTVSPQRHLKTFMGSIYPQAHGENRWEGQLVTVLEFNASAKAYVDGLLSGLMQRQIRLKATTGATSSTREFTIDFAGTLTDGVKLFDDRDGNMTVSLTWNGTYNSALANWLKVKVRHNLSIMP